MIKKLLLILLLASIPSFLLGQIIALKESLLQPYGVVMNDTLYKGKKCVQVIESNSRHNDAYAIVGNTNFKNGVIEVELSGDRRPESDTTMRGFVGIAFRMQNKDTSNYECFYLRPTNGRANDMLRRNHATQYVSEPEYSWQRLRKESPGVYESYTDLQPGEWTKIKIVVKDYYAALYVGNAAQPCLIVNDLKHGITTGPVALWIGSGTVAYFRDLKITKQD